MDPVSAAGLALAVLPLVVTVFEDYKAAIQPFLMLRHSERQARRFGESLKTQQTIFENACRHLLSLATGQGAEMLGDPGHHLWHDTELDQTLSACLKDSLDRCVSIIESIKDVLEEIRNDTFDGFLQLQRPKEETQMNLRTRISHKFKLAFSNKDLSMKIEMLRTYNADLNILCKQVEYLKNEKRTILPQSPKSSNAAIVHQHKRNASRRLHETLLQVWSCFEHLEHSVNISLDGNPSRVTASKVFFDLVFTFSRPLDGILTEKPMWVTIESIQEQSEDAADPEILCTCAICRTSTVFQSREKSEKMVGNLPAPPWPSASEIAPCDLCSVENMCFYIQSHLQTSVTAPPIGYIQKTKALKFVIYPRISIEPDPIRSKSLHDTLQAVPNTQGMWLPEKLRVARILALAVLEFHSTPWLNEDWRSRDVLFFNSKDLSEDKLGSPYLAALLPTISDNTACELPGGQVSGKQSWSSVPNATLFRLGVILLELGLEKPFCDLQVPEDIKVGDPAEFTEFLTAKRLSRNSAVSRKMGLRYGRLVNRCLFCDFGLGGQYELDTVELQNAFFRSVILELDACLKAIS